MPTPSRRAEATTAVLAEADRAVSGKSPIAPHPPGGDGPRAGDAIAGKYELTRVLGQGGMGAVWLARNLTLDADVAVKLIRREKATPAASARLLKEAQLAARLSHASIVRIFDFGTTDDGDPFIVMELLRGESLGQLVERKGRLPPVRAVQVLLPVVAALQAAHAKGVVHRDLKPDNIFLAESPTGTTPKVVDFGIAKLQDASVDGSLTQTGVVLGSPDYMSPEQARGRTRVDERTDVWGLSVVLYECVTGLAPFQVYNYNALLAAIIEDEPTSFADLGVRDGGLWPVVARGLAKRPEDRWPSARDLGRALVEWLHGQDVHTDITGAALADDWGSDRRPLSEPLPCSQREPPLLDEAGAEAPANDDALVHAAIPPPPRMPDADALVPHPPREPARPQASRASARALSLVAVALLSLGALGAMRAWRAQPRASAGPAPVGVPPATAAVVASAPIEPPASAAAVTSAPAVAPASAPPSASAPAPTSPGASAEPAASASPVEAKKPPVRASTPGRPKKPGTMPLPARPDF